MQRDMLSAPGVIDGVVRSSDLLVDITDTEGKVSRSVPLREVIADDQEEYNDRRATLLAEGKCTTGGGSAPIYFLELVGNLILIDVKGGTVVAVAGLRPSAGYLTAITPKSRSPVRSLLSWPRLSSLQRCVHHATATPIFRDAPARRSEKRVAPELQRHRHHSPNLAADLSCGPHTAKSS